MAEPGGGAEGIAVPAVTDWFRKNLPEVTPPLAFELIAGGNSNLTYRVADAGRGRWILRRPPLRHLLPTAHDIQREYRVLSALAPVGLPIPEVYGYCSDPGVNGAPFYVMSFVAGTVLHDLAAATSLDLEGRRRAAETLVDVLVALHQVDLDAVGLGDLGRREGYIARQIRRWYKQYELSRTEELPLMAEVRDALEGRIPAQRETTIVHGDFRLGNCICDPHGRILAVLDWEVCTLGDPLADISYVLSTWAHPEDRYPAGPTAPSMAPGFPSQRELLERYAERSGRDVSSLDYFLAFHFWRHACICEEVYARYLHGAYGESRELGELHALVETYAQVSAELLRRLG